VPTAAPTVGLGGGGVATGGGGAPTATPTLDQAFTF
jgi:hypothetical protein